MIIVVIILTIPIAVWRVFSLMLMAMYNVSINQKGFKYLRSKPSLITQLAWLVQSMW